MVVTRQVLIDSKFSTVIRAPVYSVHDGLSTQVPIDIDEGLRHESSIHCDESVSLPKSSLTDYVGSPSGHQVIELTRPLRIALAI